MQPLQPSPDEQTIGSRDLTRWYSRPGRWLSEIFGALADRLRNTELAVLVTLGLALVLAVGGTILAGEIYETVASGHGVAQLDEPLLKWVLAARTPGFTAVVVVFSASGGTVWMTILTSAALTGSGVAALDAARADADRGRRLAGDDGGRQADHRPGPAGSV